MASSVDVAVGLPVRGTYTYSLPPQMHCEVGTRVLVPFGPRGVTGVVVRRHATPRDDVRAVHDVLEGTLPADIVELCLWAADYYEAPPGEVLRAALPAGLQESWGAARPRLTPLGLSVLRGDTLSAIDTPTLRLLEGVKAGKRAPRSRLEPLIETGLVTLESARETAKVKPRLVPAWRKLREPTVEEERALARARAQRLMLEELGGGAVVTATALKAKHKGAPAALRLLAGRGLVEKTTLELRRAPSEAGDEVPVYAPATALPPTPGQAAALERIAAAEGFRGFLLHGVTGSGKTEVYLQAIARVLAAGKTALVLVPEIALTPQLAARFRARFGDQVAVLHSGLAPGERYDEWRRLRSGAASIALGARSAVFAPLERLGIVVVDEEHDPSFKQEEGVRYHARDVALVRAKRAGAVCVLGSATPSLESWAGTTDGRLELVPLTDRAHGRALPPVDVVDLRVYRPDPESMLSAPLAAALDETLAKGEQAILFLNRRGFATFVVCVGCGHPFRCPACSVSLTYHKTGDRLRCHYCGHAEHVPTDCPKCHATETIRRFGLGTERIEAALAARYPSARVARLDRDTAAGRGLRDVLQRVAKREIDILVGTQMVTKGHDFPHVTLVGVLAADSALSTPDFRAGERTFQLLTQVAGRAGRGDGEGRVLVQTYNPEHPAIACAKGHDYAAFVASELTARQELGYPPVGRLVALRLDGSDEGEVRHLAERVGVEAAPWARAVGIELLGPAEAPLAKLKGRARWQLWAKGGDRAVLRAFVRRVLQLVDGMGKPSVRVTVDVDPISTM
jgi:primosomal protein N' (replication factor Y) (superfamily II helicase)